MTVTKSPAPTTAATWPDLAVVPAKPIHAAIAARLVRRLARTLPLRIEGPGGSPLVAAAGQSGVTGPVLRLHRPDAFYRRVGAGGLIGFGEAYQAGDWDADDLPGVLSVFAAAADRIVPKPLQWARHVYAARQPHDEANTVDGARRNVQRHYDLSNDLFGLFLDPSMMYSSALFAADELAMAVPDPDRPDLGRPDPGSSDPGRVSSAGVVASSATLTAAQHAKIDRLLDRIGVRAGTRLLEIGTGWGELAIRAACRGATVHTVTISAEQHALALRRAQAAGMADRIDFELRDYRRLDRDRSYDAIASVEMVEAVGERFWPEYFSTLDRLLAPGGRAGIQAITMRHARMLATRRTYTWMHKYIFPGGLIPSVEAIRTTLAAHTRLHITDEFTFGRHYAATLRLWRHRFTAQAENVAALGFDQIFRRTWDFYLAYSEAGFRTGYLDVAQLVLERS